MSPTSSPSQSCSALMISPQSPNQGNQLTRPLVAPKMDFPVPEAQACCRTTLLL